MGCIQSRPSRSSARPPRLSLAYRGISLSSQWPSEAQTRVEASDPPPLLDLCVSEVAKNFREYESFERIPNDVILLVLQRIVKTLQPFSPKDLEVFSHYALEEYQLADCLGVDDYWMEIIGSEGGPLVKLNISNSLVTDEGLALLGTCTNLQSLTMDVCDDISDTGLSVLTGFSNLTTLSLRSNWLITAAGMQHFVHLVNLRTLDLERCPNTLGGLKYIKDLTTLEKLNVGWRFGVRDNWDALRIGTGDIMSLAGLVNLVELEISKNKVFASSIASLGGLTKLRSLGMEGCPLVRQYVDSITGLTKLRHLNVRACILPDDGFQKLGGLVNLRSLNIGKNYITSRYTGFLKGLTNLERLYLDSNSINGAGIEAVEGLVNLRLLDISSTLVRNDSMGVLAGLTKLESLNLADTGGEASHGIPAIGTITSLTSLNLESKMVTNAGLCSLVGLTGLVALDLHGAEITDTGMSCFKHFKKLQSLDLCGCEISHVGVRKITALTSLTYLNLSQNMLLTDLALQHLSGMKNLVSLNLAGTRVTNAGVEQHLRPLTQLRCLTLFGCAISRSALFHFRDSFMPGLCVIRLQ